MCPTGCTRSKTKNKETGHKGIGIKYYYTFSQADRPIERRRKQRGGTTIGNGRKSYLADGSSSSTTAARVRGGRVARRCAVAASMQGAAFDIVLCLTRWRLAVIVVVHSE